MTRLLLLPLVILVYGVLVNQSKLDNFPSAVVHIALQSVLIWALFIQIQRVWGLRLLLSLFFGVGLLARVAYDSSLSMSVLMSVLETTPDELSSFLQFNLLAVGLSVAMFIALVYAPVPPKRSMYWGGVVFGVGYVVMPTILSLDELLGTQTHKDYVKMGLAKGYSQTGATLEYLVEEDMFWRLPALKNIKGFSDTANFFFRRAGSASEWTLVSSDSSADDLLVIGLGESLRADHLSVYGYERETTPRLKAKESHLSLYQSAYSAGPNTWNSLPAMLTKVDVYPDISKSVVNLAKDAGYEVFWFSNHAENSRWDFSVSAIASQADHTDYFSSEQAGSVYDGDLIKKLQVALQKRQGKALVFLHFYGSHMTFDKRYPPAYNVFSGSDATLDSYDNSVRYTDHVQNEIINLIQSIGGKYLFLSDHGLGDPKGDIPLKHDLREPPELDSLKVPLFTFPKSDLHSRELPVSLYYFECLFARWAKISARELTEHEYCSKAMASEEVVYIDSNMKHQRVALTHVDKAGKTDARAAAVSGAGTHR